MKKSTLLIISLAWVTGCGTVPKTSSQLVETSSTTQTFCYPLPREEVGERVEGLLSQCYGPVETIIPIGSVYVPMRADFQVVNEELPNGNRYSVRNFVGFGYSADVVGNVGDCDTEVRMYAVSGFWKKAFVAVDRAIRGEEKKCP